MSAPNPAVAGSVSIPGTSGDAVLELITDPSGGVLQLKMTARRRSRPLGALTQTGVRQLREILGQPAGSGFLAVPSPPDGQLLLYVERHGETTTLTVASGGDYARTFGPVSISELEVVLKPGLVTTEGLS